MNLSGQDAIERALSLLAAALEAGDVAPVSLVIIGGAAMNVLGLRIRPTKDVDVLAIRGPASESSEIVLLKHKPLPEPLVRAAEQVAEALDLDPGWLNAGPADLLDWGLPEGFERRLTERTYGPRLTVLLPAREDLVCLKVYAAADTGPGRHTEDLRALHPTRDEILSGVRWARTQDPSEGFRSMVTALLAYLDVDVAEGDIDGS
jgi:hypothetical protein